RTHQAPVGVLRSLGHDGSSSAAARSGQSLRLRIYLDLHSNPSPGLSESVITGIVSPHIARLWTPIELSCSAPESGEHQDHGVGTMPQVTATELRKGMLVDLNGKTATITFWNLWKSDRRSKVQLRFREILTGRTSEATAQPDDRYIVLESEVIDIE